MRILVIEDNLIIATNLSDYLEMRGHEVAMVRDGKRGFRLAASQAFDVILLDLGLPGMDGSTLCAKLRQEACVDTPILILTARDTLRDKLDGFEYGADDYLVKPFDLEEVEARLGALHRRRSGKVANRVLRVGTLVCDLGRRAVTYKGAEVELTPKGMRLLEMLMGEPGRVFSRREIEVELWGEEQETSSRLRNHVHVLRRALLRAGKHDPIETVHGFGFRLPEQAQDGDSRD